MFLTPEYLAIAMEYATDGDMFQLVVRQRGLLEKDARWYFQQLIVAVDYCHRMVRFCNGNIQCRSTSDQTIYGQLQSEDHLGLRQMRVQGCSPRSKGCREFEWDCVWRRAWPTGT